MQYARVALVATTAATAAATKGSTGAAPARSQRPALGEQQLVSSGGGAGERQTAAAAASRRHARAVRANLEDGLRLQVRLRLAATSQQDVQVRIRHWRRRIT